MVHTIDNIRRRKKENVILPSALCKDALKSTEVKLIISASANILLTVRVTASRCVITVATTLAMLSIQKVAVVVIAKPDIQWVDKCTLCVLYCTC